MITYFVIGIVVQIIILIERYCRLDVVRNVWKDKGTYVWTLLFSIINVVTWPIAIIAEIRNIIIETKGSGSCKHGLFLFQDRENNNLFNEESDI